MDALFTQRDFLVIIDGKPSTSSSLVSWLSGNWQEQFEFWWELVFGIESIREVDSSYSAVGMDLNSKGLNVVGSVSSSGEIRQVELNLVPSLIKSHRHGTDEWLNSSG